MILTCPQCASRYQIDAAAIPPQGRSVRCASCGNAWRAKPDGEAAPAPAAVPPEPRAFAPAAAQPDLDVEAVEPAPEPEKPAAAIPKTIRAKNQAKKRTREAALAGVVWGVLGALLIALIAGAALFRVEVVRLWPRTAGAYAKVGLPVNPVGLAPENIQAGPALRQGHAAVVVTGQVRNVETRPHDPAPLRIALLDKTGRPLAFQTVALPEGALQPGQTRPFTATFLDPPADSAGVEVAFAFGAPPTPRNRRAKMEEALRLRGPAEAGALRATKTAEPLPAPSPYALPSPAEANRHPRHEG